MSWADAQRVVLRSLYSIKQLAGKETPRTGDSNPDFFLKSLTQVPVLKYIILIILETSPRLTRGSLL